LRAAGGGLPDAEQTPPASQDNAAGLKKPEALILDMPVAKSAFCGLDPCMRMDLCYFFFTSEIGVPDCFWQICFHVTASGHFGNMGSSAPNSNRGSLFRDKVENRFKAADADLLNKVYAFTITKAEGNKREPLRAAELLIDHNADALTIASALLAPLVWQGRVELSEISSRFGQSFDTTLKELSPPFMLRDDSEHHRRQDIRALLSSLHGHPRKAVILIAFRLLELEDALAHGDATARQMARETLDFYVPIANRLSLGELRRRLEDACFHILDKSAYKRLKQEVAAIQADDDKYLEILMTGVRRLLHKNGIHGRIQGRTKSLHGILRKMKRTGKGLDEIMDRVGLRVIVSSVPECYAVLGLLHSHFKPIPGTFDDYIGLPKDNGYQSLHTCVYPVREVSHKPIEIQVRTELMHMEAEHGVAAHWRYKNQTASRLKTHPQAQWMQGLLEQHENTDSTGAFIDLLHRQVFRDHLVVFGNGGRIMRLPENATVKDYLKRSNTRLPDSATVRVNGEVSATARVLRDGDSIEIVDAKASDPDTPRSAGINS
jgi:GTP pyrophosphokinase